MIDPKTFIAALSSAKLGWTIFAKAIERSEVDVKKWLDGLAPIPPYICLTITAVQFDMLPADNIRMGFDDVWSILGIERQRVMFWREAGETYPLSARLAVTAYDYTHEQKRLNMARPERLDHNQFRILSNIVRAGKYWRVSGGWRARPQVGITFPKMAVATPDELMRLGLIEKGMDRAQTYIHATKAGQQIFYGRDRRKA